MVIWPFFAALSWPGQEYKRKQLEEQRQAERLQRQLKQERDYLVSLQHQRQEQRPVEKKPLYHYKEGMSPSEKPAWAKEVSEQASVTAPCWQAIGRNEFIQQKWRVRLVL